MDDRLKLHSLLLSLGTKNVYYQSPGNISMNYPAIVYEKSKIENKHANNDVYIQNNKYTVTIISKSIDDVLVNKISLLPKCTHDRHFIADGLHHDVFNLYY